MTSEERPGSFVPVGAPVWTETKGFCTRRVSLRGFLAASPERVWQALADAEHQRRWNSTLIELQGTIREGERLMLRSTVDPGRTFRLTVERLQANSEMVWSGGPRGVFHGRRSFTLLAIEGGCQLEVSESFRGFAVPIAARFLPDFEPSFRALWNDLRLEVESS